MRTCGKCRSDLEEAAFTASELAKAWSVCRECRRAYNRKHADPLRVVKPRLGASEDARREWARKKLREAVGRYGLPRPDACARCSEPGPVEGHHHDYDRPLDVEWLCRGCHSREHFPL